METNLKESVEVVAANPDVFAELVRAFEGACPAQRIPESVIDILKDSGCLSGMSEQALLTERGKALVYGLMERNHLENGGALDLFNEFEVDGRVVVDLGCGAGVYAREALRLGAEKVVALDVSPDMIAVAQALDTGTSCVYKLLEASKVIWPVEDCSADLVMARLVLPYVDPFWFFQQASRVLKPGGKLLLVVHSKDYYLGRLRDNLAWSHRRRLAQLSFALFSGVAFRLFRIIPEVKIGGRKRCDCWYDRNNLVRLAARYSFTPDLINWPKSAPTPQLIFKLDK